MPPRREPPPIIPNGLRPLSLAEMRALCVDNFQGSESRMRIMAGLEEFVRLLEGLGLSGELWVDGSFLTQKFQPGDADVVFRPRIEFADSQTPEQKAFLDRLADFSDDELICECHAHLWYEYPESDTRHRLNAHLRPYWLNAFGRNRVRNEPKGIAVVAVGGGL